MIQLFDGVRIIVSSIVRMCRQKPQTGPGCPIGHQGAVCCMSNPNRATLLLFRLYWKLYDIFLFRIDLWRAYGR